MTVRFRVVRIQKNTVTGNQHSVPNTMIVDRLTHARSIIGRSSPTTTSSQLGLHLTNDRTSSEACDNDTNKSENVIDWKVKHIGKEDDLCYVVRGHGFELRDDIVEPERQIP